MVKWALKFIGFLSMFRTACPRFAADRSFILGHLRIAEWQFFAAVLILLFTGLVGLGTTGSSLSFCLDNNQLSSENMQIFAGNPKQIRMDEWVVFTPYAIAQVNHDPPFPVVNRNLGPDGQNMLVVGMTGAPVLNLSALAKPATWGFFFLDLRRALAWYWWFPIFGCLFALWGMMHFLMPGRWRLALGLAGIFCSSAYVIAWSNWPAYAVFFPSLAFSLFMLIMSADSASKLTLLSLFLGLAVAGFVLVLYPPWQVTLGYLFLAILAGIVVRDRMLDAVSWRRVVALIGAFAVAFIICVAWWRDAGPAIDAMLSTVYPGRRTAVTGGGQLMWRLLRGFLNIHTLYSDGAKITNQSESSSFTYFLPLVFASMFVELLRGRKPSWPMVGIFVFCLFSLWFQFVGIPKPLAELSLWGRVPVSRADLALGLACILTCGLALSKLDDTGKPSAAADRLLPWIFSVCWAVTVYAAIAQTPKPLKPSSPAIVLGIVFLVFAMGIWLNGGKKMFISAWLMWNLAVALPFNPMAIAPKRIPVPERLLHSDRLGIPRVLVVGTQVTPMMLVAAGVPVANGVFYYPQPAIWRRLDPDGAHATLTNRYQHLLYVAEEVNNPDGYRLENPRADVVKVIFDATKFDFRLTSAQRVLVPKVQAKVFKANTHLRYVDKIDGWVLFDVI